MKLLNSTNTLLIDVENPEEKTDKINQYYDGKTNHRGILETGKIESQT